MTSKYTASPMRASRVEQPALTLGRKKGFQSRQTSTLQDVSNLSSRNAQDDDFSTADSFSLCSNMPQNHHSPQQMDSWTMSDATLMMSSNSSCSSQSTGGDSFETSMISTTEPSPQDSGMFFSSFPQQMLQSSTGHISNEGPSPNYTPLSELQAMQDMTDSPQMAFTHSQGFPEYSPVMDFSSDHSSHLTTPDCCPDDSGLIESKCRTMEDTQMFAGNDAWNPLSMDAELFPNAAVDQLSSLFHPMPVSPPLTEASNDISVTSACSQSSYPPYPAQDNALFGEISMPAVAGKPENAGDQYFPSTPPLTDEQDPHRTIRAPKQSQRPLVSAATVRPPLKSGSEYYGGLPISEPLRQRSRDGQESRSPRDHKYYFLPTRSDGKYYCPFSSDEKPCAHPPTTQKCAYHKYLDSHLRPYHCKVPQCVDVRFSSNACLFRHEREAHGMHGHGENPHLCLFKDCERSVVGNGFPRRWNLHDHMKRVHDYTSSERVSSPEASPPGSTQGSKKKENPGRKRKGQTATGATLMKRTRSTQSQKSAKAAQSQAQIDQQLQNAHRDYFNCLYRLQSELGKLTPEDPDLHDKANASLQELHTLGINYRSMQAGNAASQVARNFSA